MTTFLIALLFLFKPVLPIMEYLANYNYIATELCENRDKPKMHCDGKCHLMKQLAKASEHEKPISEKKQASAERELLFFEPYGLPNINLIQPFQKRSLFALKQNLFGRLTYYSLLPPPVYN